MFMPQGKPTKPRTKPEPKPVAAPSAEDCYLRLQAEIDAVPLTDARPVSLDVQQAAMVGLGVHDILQRPEHRDAVQALTKLEIIDGTLVLGLADIARAAWYTRYKVLMTGAVTSEAALPVTLLDPALALRARMRKTLEYQLDDDASVQPLLAQLRLGAGHLDLANDLLGYADMYGQFTALLLRDGKNYRPTDEAEARKLSGEITRALGVGTTPEQTAWRTSQARAFFLLRKHYEEAVRLGRFLYHYEDGESLFPSLFAAVRAAPTREKPADPPSGTDPSTPPVA